MAKTLFAEYQGIGAKHAQWRVLEFREASSIAPLADSHVTTGSDSDYRLDDGKPCTRDPATGEFILSQTGERFRAERI